MQASTTAPTGTLALTVVRHLGTLRARPTPRWWQIRNWLQNRRRELPALAVYRLLGRLCSLVYIESALYLRVIHADGTYTDLGCAGRRVVTDAGAAAMATSFKNNASPGTFNYHGFGTGTTAESAAQTALITEFTTEYAVNSTRPTGAQSNPSAPVYQTVATFSPDSGGTLAVTEHAPFDQAATSGGTMLDRTKFAAVNLVAASDSLQATYQLTFVSGS